MFVECPFAKTKENTRGAVACQTGIRRHGRSIHANAI
jgi:hypothetical protein